VGLAEGYLQEVDPMSSVRLAAPIALLLAALAIPAVAEEFAAAATLARGRLLVDGSIEAIGPYPFLLDTCISQGILHNGVDAYLSLSRLDQPENGMPKVAAPFALGPLEAGHETFLVADLTPLAERLGSPLGGIVPAHQPGLEITLDFPGARVVWRSLDSALLLDATVPGAMPMLLDEEGAPQVQVLLAGSHLIPARLDTAYGGLLSLPEKTLRDMGMAPPEEMLTLHPQGQDQRQVLLPSVAAGPARLRPCLCDIAAPGEPARVGLAFLRHFRVTLNYEHGLLRFESDSSLDLILPAPAGTGIVPSVQRDGNWTIGVVSGSPAALAGVTPQHLLLQVNGRKAGAFDAGSLQAALNGRLGEQVTVITEYNGAQGEQVLQCAELLRP
jgi:hypothetical protein